MTLTGWKRSPGAAAPLDCTPFFYFLPALPDLLRSRYGLDWRENPAPDERKNLHLVCGLMAPGLILLALAVTSTKFWMKHLGKNWKAPSQNRLPGVWIGLPALPWALKGSPHHPERRHHCARWQVVCW